MRVVRIDNARRLKIFHENVPAFRADEVLLDIKAVGVCGSDLHRFRGVTFDQEENKGLILGHEFSAIVEDTGKSVQNVQPGDRVAVEPAIHCGTCEWCIKGYYNLCENIKFCGVPPQDGALREKMVWPAHLVYKLLPSLNFDDGVLLEPMAICLYAVDLSPIKPGQTAAVLGAGPIGLGIVHLLKRTAGCRTVFATEKIPARCDMAAQLGADVIINASDENAVDAIMDHTNGRGVDVVFEAAGESETFEQSIELCTLGGHVLFIGIPEDDRMPFSAASARRKGVTMRLVRRSLLTVPRCMQLMDSGIIDVRSMVTHHFSLDHVQKAFKLVDHYQDGVVKAIIGPE